MRIIFFFVLISCSCISTVLNAEEEIKRNELSSNAGEKKDEIKKKQRIEKDSSKSPHKLTSAVTFISDYRSRGISQTFLQPAVQGEIKYTHESGIYFKSWGSNVDGTGHLLNNTSMEWDLYLGFKHQLLQSSVEYDIGLLYYYFPGGRAPVPANTSYNTLEYYFAAIYKGLEVRLWLTLTDFYGTNSSNPPMNWDKGRPVRPNGHSYGSPYLEINYDYLFYPKWKLSFHLGYQGVTNYPEIGYLDWFMTLTREFEWFDVTLTYVETNARKAFYDIPDNSYKPQRVNLGGPWIIIGIDRSF